jgi:hypothetical protein
MTNEPEVIWKEIVMASSRHYPSTYLKELKKKTQKKTQFQLRSESSTT